MGLNHDTIPGMDAAVRHASCRAAQTGRAQLGSRLSIDAIVPLLLHVRVAVSADASTLPSCAVSTPRLGGTDTTLLSGSSVTVVHLQLTEERHALTKLASVHIDVNVACH